MKTIITDMGGVLYSFDASHDPVKHREAFDEVMRQLGISGADLKVQLEGEKDAIKKGLLKIYPISTSFKIIRLA